MLCSDLSVEQPHVETAVVETTVQSTAAPSTTQPEPSWICSAAMGEGNSLYAKISWFAAVSIHRELVNYTQ